jgi:hypothetical protein
MFSILVVNFGFLGLPPPNPNPCFSNLGTSNYSTPHFQENKIPNFCHQSFLTISHRPPFSRWTNPFSRKCPCHPPLDPFPKFLINPHIFSSTIIGNSMSLHSTLEVSHNNFQHFLTFENQINSQVWEVCGTFKIGKLDPTSF